MTESGPRRGTCRPRVQVLERCARKSGTRSGRCRGRDNAGSGALPNADGRRSVGDASRQACVERQFAVRPTSRGRARDRQLHRDRSPSRAASRRAWISCLTDRWQRRRPVGRPSLWRAQQGMRAAIDRHRGVNRSIRAVLEPCRVCGVRHTCGALGRQVGRRSGDEGVRAAGSKLGRVEAAPGPCRPAGGGGTWLVWSPPSWGFRLVGTWVDWRRSSLGARSGGPIVVGCRGHTFVTPDCAG